MKTLVRHMALVLLLAVAILWVMKPAHASTTAKTTTVESVGPQTTTTTKTTTVTTVTKTEKESKSEFRARMDGELSNLKTQIDDLSTQAQDSTGRARAKLDAQVKTLREKRDLVQKNLEEASDSSGRAWTRMRAGLEKAVGEIKSGYSEAKTELQTRRADSKGNTTSEKKKESAE